MFSPDRDRIGKARRWRIDLSHAARLPRTVVMLGIVSFFTDFSSEMIYPLLPLFLATVLGAGAARGPGTVLRLLPCHHRVRSPALEPAVRISLEELGIADCLRGRQRVGGGGGGNAGRNENEQGLTPGVAPKSIRGQPSTN